VLQLLKKHLKSNLRSTSESKVLLQLRLLIKSLMKFSLWIKSSKMNNLEKSLKRPSRNSQKNEKDFSKNKFKTKITQLKMRGKRRK